MKIATLKGCKQCAKLKANIFGLYVEIDCDSNPEFCDSLEATTNTFKYPMAIVNNTDLYYVAESYEDLKLINTKKGDYILKPQASLEQMIEKLKQ